MILNSPDDTDRLGAALASTLAPGLSIAMSGPIGAGKSHLARAIIRHLCGDTDGTLEIPSPTYTLVQCYDTPLGTLWHADLYRLTDPNEAWELGLIEALDTAICLVEWPKLLGKLPANVLLIDLATQESSEQRRATLSAQPGPWIERIEGADLGVVNS